MTVHECLACARFEGIVIDHTKGESVVICRSAPSEKPVTADRPNEPDPSSRISLDTIMTRNVICVRETDRIEDIRALLVDGNIGGVPVVDDHERPIGIVSKTDLARETHDSTGSQFALEAMTPIAFALPRTATVSEASALMALEGVHRLPVVDHDGRVVGIVSSLDVLRWLARRNGHRVPPRSQEAPVAD